MKYKLEVYFVASNKAKKEFILESEKQYSIVSKSGVDTLIINDVSSKISKFLIALDDVSYIRLVELNELHEEQLVKCSDPAYKVTFMWNNLKFSNKRQKKALTVTTSKSVVKSLHDTYNDRGSKRFIQLTLESEMFYINLTNVSQIVYYTYIQ